MIVVDTSALMAIVQDEPEAEWVRTALDAQDGILISAGTLAEALIVAERRRVGAKMRRLLDAPYFEVVSVTPESALRIAEAYGRWGKGVHSAALNFGDCFAYELAQSKGCDLLFVGNDFAQTDLNER